MANPLRISDAKSSKGLFILVFSDVTLDVRVTDPCSPNRCVSFDGSIANGRENGTQRRRRRRKYLRDPRDDVRRLWGDLLRCCTRQQVIGKKGWPRIG